MEIDKLVLLQRAPPTHITWCGCMFHVLLCRGSCLFLLLLQGGSL